MLTAKIKLIINTTVADEIENIISAKVDQEPLSPYDVDQKISTR